MISSRVSPKPFSIARRSTLSFQYKTSRRCFRDSTQSYSHVPILNFPNPRRAGLFLSLGLGGGCLYLIGFPIAIHAEAVPMPAEVKLEKARKKASSREENRELISSQHLQVKKSWENPGVYAWGNNTGRVVAPDSTDDFIKTARRITYFDGKLIRDMKLHQKFAAAINENGDLLQWGTGFSPNSTGPTFTLRGKDLVKLSISKDRILALSSNGKVYSISAAQSEQLSEPKPLESSWFPFWKSRSPLAYRQFELPSMSWGERISEISSGLEHCLFLTSKGRIFSAASGSRDFPSRGQLGVPGLTSSRRATGPFDQLHEISTLKGFEIAKIATGDYHSLAADKQGRVFTFGDNSLGQLGLDYSPESPIIDTPSLLPINKLYKGTNMSPKVTGVAAGGMNSFFTIDATRVASQADDGTRNLGRVTAETWSCGQGILGGLGNGRWTHIQGTPTKIKALSGLFEYDEVNKEAVPIRLARLSVGATHMSAVMNNVTHVTADHTTSENDTNWGADVLWWGGNEYYQLGTGRRNNVSQPVYIAPLDIEADREKGRREEHRFQITPRTKIQLSGRRNVSVEQRIECGRGVTAVYSGT